MLFRAENRVVKGNSKRFIRSLVVVLFAIAAVTAVRCRSSNVLSGIVLCPDGQAAVGCLVIASQNDGRTLSECATDDRGRFLFASRHGDSLVDLSTSLEPPPNCGKDGVLRASIRGVEFGTEDVVLQLVDVERDQTIRVVDSANEPISGVKVRFRPPPVRAFDTTTDQNGELRVRVVEGVHYALRFVPPVGIRNEELFESLLSDVAWNGSTKTVVLQRLTYVHVQSVLPPDRKLDADGVHRLVGTVYDSSGRCWGSVHILGEGLAFFSVPRDLGLVTVKLEYRERGIGTPITRRGEIEISPAEYDPEGPVPTAVLVPVDS